MGKPVTIHSFFKKNVPDTSEANSSIPTSSVEVSNQEERPKKVPRIEIENNVAEFERDPGLRQQISMYPLDQRDQIRRAYIKAGPYQYKLDLYPASGSASHQRRFQYSWFEMYPSWLEYSPAKDAAFCLPCFLFYNPDIMNKAFVVEGFKNWKKVRNGKHCSFMLHVGKELNSEHKKAEKACEDLMNQRQHLPQMLDKQTSEQIANNRLRLQTSIDAIQYLTFQGCALRGHDESQSSINQGNFIEYLKRVRRYSETVAGVILDKAPRNAIYTSSDIQKDILNVMSNMVKKKIREKIGDEKYCIIVDEARDQSKREQMTLVLRFVDNGGCIHEYFFGLVHVQDTKALTLKNAIFSVLSNNGLDVQNIRGQGYDGASNMRGEWKGLQALIADDCPYAYYVHCLAHRLQLTLVAASRDVKSVHKFFGQLSFIINVVDSSSKRHDELQVAQADEIAHLISQDKLETGRGLNQIGTLKRAGDTRWSSHLKSISSVLQMYNASIVVLNNISEEGSTAPQRGDADSAVEMLISFEFVFILHVMKEIMEITDVLCQALQRQSIDISNAMKLVTTTKDLLLKLRADGWDTLFTKVKLFCDSHNVETPHMNALYNPRQGRARKQQDDITFEHYYRVDIFYSIIDSQWQEFDNRFSGKTMELLTLTSCLDPQNVSKFFKLDEIGKLVEKFYPGDFTVHEQTSIRMELRHFELDLLQHEDYDKLLTISDLCQWMVKTKKSEIYRYVFRLIKLVLTLPISTATAERSFSAMNKVKTKLRNKMEDEFLSDSLMLYIEREIAETLSMDSIIDTFRDSKERRVLL